MSSLGLGALLLVLSKPPRTQSPRQSQRGQGLVETALIVLLIALVAIAGVILLAPIIQHSFAALLPTP